MTLTKRRIGDLIAFVDERNTGAKVKDFRGLNINKEFMPTVANVENVNPVNYKVVRKGRFVFSGMQTGRDECIRLSLYKGETPIVVSPAYTTFEIKDGENVLSEYFFMLFLRREMDRLGWFYSDSSIRSNLDIDRFCDIELDLPPQSLQQKYVDIYNSMLANQHAYEGSLEDLKLTCDAYVERLRRELPHTAIGSYIKQSDKRNSQGLSVEAVRGLAVSKAMIDTKADMNGVSLANYKVVPPMHIAYVPDTSRRGEKISLGYNETDEPYLVSSISIVFGTDHSHLLPEYLMLFFARSEFDRYTRFHSWGSAREVFSWEDMCEVKIPIPDVKVQESIVNIYKVYKARRQVNDHLKTQIRALCPILINGSIAEAKTVGD